MFTIVENEHDVREQAMAAAQIDDPSPSKEAPRPACHLPGFIQLFTRQASCAADGAGQAIE